MSPLFVVGPAVCGLVVAITSAVLIQALGIDAVGDGLLFGAIVGVGYLFADTVDVGGRARALEAAGAIRGYHAEIDPASVDRGFEVVVPRRADAQGPGDVEAFEERIAQMDAVVECRRMFGVPDYVIRVAVGDAAAYETFYMTQLAELPGLARVNSQFTMKTVKAGGGVPLGER